MNKPTKALGRRMDPPNDRKMILDPDMWPKWPMLPMVRRDTHRSALIVGDPTPAGEVWFVPDANLFSFTSEEIAKRGSFRSVDDVLAEGWVVD